MKKQLIFIALLSIATTQLNAADYYPEFNYEDYHTVRYNPDFPIYKNIVIGAIHDYILANYDRADITYLSKDENNNPTPTTLNTLLRKAIDANNEATLRPIDIHFQNTLHLIHQ